jgi:hypothetical protein
MRKISVLVLSAICLLLAMNFATLKARATTYPSAESPTLFTSLSPSNASLGSNISWLIWTDTNSSGSSVSLEIEDETNSSSIYQANLTLGTLNQCGSLVQAISTAGFTNHLYKFKATTVINGMEIESTRYLDFSAPISQFLIIASPSSFQIIAGDPMTVNISEITSPYVDATATAVVYNGSNPNIQTISDINIPSSSGNAAVPISTSTLSAGIYYVNVTATSSLGNASFLAGFQVAEIIVEANELYYYVGETINISIRTYPSVTQAGLQIFVAGFPPTIAVDENVTLTDGKASALFDSTTWSPDSYVVYGNATIDGGTVYAATSFVLLTFDVSVETDKSAYSPSEMANVTLTTTPPQANAEFNFTVTNSTDDIVYAYGPATLNAQGEASVAFITTGLAPDDYSIQAFVNNTHDTESDTTVFTIVTPTFNIYASVSPFSNNQYAMPTLNVTVMPQQNNANMSIAIDGLFGTFYNFTRYNFSLSTYLYALPTAALPNGTYGVEVRVSSPAGTNTTIALFAYSNSVDSDGDGLSDSDELSRSTNATRPDTDGDGFFDGIEVFHGSDPLSATSVVSESLALPLVILIPLVSAFAFAKFRRRTAKAVH